MEQLDNESAYRYHVESDIAEASPWVLKKAPTSWSDKELKQLALEHGFDQVDGVARLSGRSWQFKAAPKVYAPCFGFKLCIVVARPMVGPDNGTQAKP